ncbi:glycosyltransferase family 2 protein [Arthrobacter sp. 754]|uniref:glycosyltransferase family 2 protein n=1 Tax=Arthrobacter sp. 754 TaxID=3156315 RepID=UPI0033966281
MNATVVILTRNEARHIRRAVESARDFRYVLVVDSESDDATALIAEQAGARVLQFNWNRQYPKKKEWSLAHTETDWVFYLDADEYFEPGQIEDIRRIIDDSSAAAYEVPLRYFWVGRELKHGHRVTKRIGMRKSKSFWPRPDDLDVGNMWEVEGHYQPQITEGSVIRAQLPIGHQDEDGLYDYFGRHNRYSDWEAHMLHKGDEVSRQSRSRLGRIAVKLPAKPVVFFIYSYFLRLGFLDGSAGLSYAIALSFYYWQIDLKIRELKNS